MTEPNPLQLAELRGESIIANFYESYGGGSAIVVAIADLMAFCNRERIPFDTMYKIAKDIRRGDGQG